MRLNRQRRGAPRWCVDREQFNNESVYDDGQRDENIAASVKLSGRLEQSGGGAWIKFGETGSTLTEEMFCILPPAELSLILSVCLELVLADAPSSVQELLKPP